MSLFGILFIVAVLTAIPTFGLSFVALFFAKKWINSEEGKKIAAAAINARNDDKTVAIPFISAAGAQSFFKKYGTAAKKFHRLGPSTMGYVGYVRIASDEEYVIMVNTTGATTLVTSFVPQQQFGNDLLSLLAKAEFLKSIQEVMQDGSSTPTLRTAEMPATENDIRPNLTEILPFEKPDPESPSKDVMEAMEWFRRLENHGDSVSLVRKGIDSDPKNWPTSDEEAVSLIRAAANQADWNARYNLGLRYAYGRGVSQSDDIATQWFKKAAYEGKRPEHPENLGAPANVLKALEWCQKKGGQGHANAQLVCGMILSGASGVPAKLSEALDWLKRAALQGNGTAQFLLAEMYKLGNGVRQDSRRAFDWYLRAAKQGDVDAMFNVAEMYRLGEGTRQKLSEAAEWYVCAGTPEALHQAGLIYRAGQGVSRDYAKARECFESAAFNAHEGARFNLGMMCAAGKGGPKDFREAISWIMPLAGGGHADSQRYLDYLKKHHRSGRGVPEDPHEAFEWFVQAAERKHEAARRSLG